MSYRLSGEEKKERPRLDRVQLDVGGSPRPCKQSINDTGSAFRSVMIPALTVSLSKVGTILSLWWCLRPRVLRAWRQRALVDCDAAGAGATDALAAQHGVLRDDVRAGALGEPHVLDVPDL